MRAAALVVIISFIQISAAESAAYFPWVEKYYDGSGYGAAYFGHAYIPDWTRTDCNAYDKGGKPVFRVRHQNRLRRPGYVPKDSKNTLPLLTADVTPDQRPYTGDCGQGRRRVCACEIDRIARGYVQALPMSLR